MKKQHWTALREEAPHAVGQCLQYFQERYIGRWEAKLLNDLAVIAYLYTQGLELQVNTFGVPSRKDWYYELRVAGELLEHRRNFPSSTAAATAGIQAAFRELENDFINTTKKSS